MIRTSSHGNSISSALPNRRASLCVCSSAVMLGMACHRVYANRRVVWKEQTLNQKDTKSTEETRQGAPPLSLRSWQRQGGDFDFRCKAHELPKKNRSCCCELLNALWFWMATDRVPLKRTAQVS